MAAKVLDTQFLGLVEFQEAYDLQRKLVAERLAGVIPDLLLLMEHPHTFILGHSGREEQVLMTDKERNRRGIALHHIDESGGVAYHGPGQLVGWAILDLPQLHYDYHDYLEKLEEILLEVLAYFGLSAHRAPAKSGVWVPVDRGLDARWTAKIASVDAVVYSKGITSFGFSLNVNPDLHFFEWMMPNDIHECSATSLAVETALAIEVKDVVAVVKRVFAEAFDFTPLEHQPVTPAFSLAPHSVAIT